MTGRAGDAQIKFRLPSEIKDWVEQQARRNGASLNSEVIRCIRERMDRMARNERSDVGQTLAGPDVAPVTIPEERQ